MKKTKIIVIVVLVLYLGAFLLSKILTLKNSQKEEFEDLNEFELLAKKTRIEVGFKEMPNEIEMNSQLAYENYKIARDYLIEEVGVQGPAFAITKFPKADNCYIVYFKSSPKFQKRFKNVLMVIVHSEKKSAMLFP